METLAYKWVATVWSLGSCAVRLAEPGGLAGHERPMPFKSMERASVHRGRLSVAF